MPDGSQFQYFQSPLRCRSYKTIYFLSAESYFRNIHLLKGFDATSLSKLLTIFHKFWKIIFNMSPINHN